MTLSLTKTICSMYFLNLTSVNYFLLFTSIKCFHSFPHVAWLPTLLNCVQSPVPSVGNFANFCIVFLDLVIQVTLPASKQSNKVRMKFKVSYAKMSTIMSDIHYALLNIRFITLLRFLICDYLDNVLQLFFKQVISYF